MNTRLRTVVLGLLLVAVTVPSAHAAPPSGAGRLLLAEVQQKMHGDWAAAWGTLTPSHQRLVSRGRYVQCERATPLPASLTSIRIMRVRTTARTAAVTVRVALLQVGSRDPFTFTRTFHLWSVAGRWTWLLSPHERTAYAKGRCPS